ncbi:hypothetical protein ACOSP7_011649 [Xanthoceras sorbifolium]
MAMEVEISNSETESRPLEPNSLVGFDEHKLQEVIAEGSLDFYEWTSLISEIENLFPDDIHKICLVYDAFLAEFPLCYGYWRKYAEHKTRLCTVEKVVEVFERAVQSATYSVGVWFDYCSFSMSAFEDLHDIRRLFRRGISFVGKDYLCHTLWDKYLEFEFSQQQWSNLAHMYIQALKFPSKKLNRYYDSFKKLAAAWKEELECQSDCAIEIQSEFVPESEVRTYYKDDEISSVIHDLLDPSDSLARSKALQKYILIGEQIYKEASRLDEKIHCFETHIRRPYFHVKPLDPSQLENWHDYLNFAEKQGDFDWVVKLYERCLIPCANYPEFWMRYVDFMESKGGREIANLALTRATQIFLKSLPVIHLFSARYKEQIGDVYAARAALLQCETESDSSFVENVAIKANMEKRLGNFVAACNVYKEALETATEKKLHSLPTLYVHFSRLKYMTTNNADAALDILVDGIKHVPGSKLLIEELIKFAMMHGGPRHMNLLDSVITKALYSGPGALQGFNVEHVEDISCLYLQFVDLCGTIDDVRKAWNWRMKLFPRSMQTSCERLSWITKPLETIIEGKKETIVALPPHPSGSDHLVQSASEDKPSPPESHDTQSDQAATQSDQVSDQKSLFPGNHDIRSDTVTVDLQSGEADNSAQESMQPVPPEASEQQREDITQPNVPSLDFVQQIANETEAVQASQEFCKDDGQREYDHEFNQDLKPLSLEGLSLDPGANESPGSFCATSHGCEVPLEPNLSHESTLKSEAQQETSASNGNVLQNGQNASGSHFVSSPMGIQPSDSAHFQTGMVSPSSSASHQTSATEAFSRPQTTANSGRNWHQKHHTNRNRRDSKFGFRGHSHKRLHQQRQVSSQQYPWAEGGGQMPMDPGYPLQSLPLQNKIQQGSQQNLYPASAILATPQARPMQNIQPQNFAPACQAQLPAQPVAYPQAQMSQHPTQSNGQHGNLHNNQAYNQMWQYYYYQQQQMQMQQPVQQLQQQQPAQQLQQQQPHDQQLLQQQLQLQQQYFQHQQMQQQLPHMQQHLQLQQQPYQQQLQQQQQYIQQQQQQQHIQQQQQQLQPYHQQSQQHLLHLQQQLQHQQPPLQIQVEQEQRVPEQQITISQNETWNNSCPKQDQGVALQHSTGAPGTVTSAASPCPQQQSPQSQ